MSKEFCLVILTMLVLLLQPATLLSGQIILHSDDQFDFALKHMEKGEYHLAVGEFERFIYFFPEDEKVPRAHYFIGVCYLSGKEYESARKVFRNVYKTYPNNALAEQALFLIGESYYRQDILEEAQRYFKMVIDKYPESGLRDAAIYRLSWSYLQVNRWQDASETFKRVEESSPLYTSAQELSEKSLKGEHLPYKDPTTAGVTAAIIPGLGHTYCNRYRDGLMAFFLNGLFLWAAVESFDQDHDVLGGIIGFLELGWYSGNIYSAVNCAYKHNRKVRDDYRKSLPDKLDLNLFTTRKGYPCLALKINF